MMNTLSEWTPGGAFSGSGENALARFRPWGADMRGRFGGASNFERLGVPANIAEQMKEAMKSNSFRSIYDNPEIQAQIMAMRQQNAPRFDGMNALAGLAAHDVMRAQPRPNWGQLLHGGQNRPAFIGGA